MSKQHQSAKQISGPTPRLEQDAQAREATHGNGFWKDFVSQQEPAKAEPSLFDELPTMMPLVGDRVKGLYDDVNTVFDDNASTGDRVVKGANAVFDLATNPSDLLDILSSSGVPHEAAKAAAGGADVAAAGGGSGGFIKNHGLTAIGGALAAFNHDATTDDAGWAAVEKGSVGAANAVTSTLMGPAAAVDWLTGSNVSGAAEGAASGANALLSGNVDRMAKASDNLRSGKHGRLAQGLGHVGHALGEGTADVIFGGEGRRTTAKTQAPWEQAAHDEKVQGLKAERTAMSDELAGRRQAKADDAAQAAAEEEARKQEEKDRKRKARARRKAREREKAALAEDKYREAMSNGAWCGR